MNANAFHNVVNIVMALLAGFLAFLLATGCTTLANGELECAQSWLPPQVTAVILAALPIVKILTNVVRDGLGGLFKKQPPVEK